MNTKNENDPQWISVSEKLPKAGEVVWVLWVHPDCRCVAKLHTMPQDVYAHFKQWERGRSNSGFIQAWMYPQGSYQVPPPPQPKTREQEDEEAYQKWIKDRDGFSTVDMWHACCAYARGEKESK